MNDENRDYLLQVTKRLSSDVDHAKYITHTVTVPEGAGKVGLILTYNNPISETNGNKATMFVSFSDPNGFRGHRMNPGGRGNVILQLWTSPSDSSEGAFPGEVVPGTWEVQIDIRSLQGEADYQLTVYSENCVAAPEKVDRSYPADHVVKAQAGWYKGELHAHSTESDGRYEVARVIQAAMDYGMDFFSLTDHSTCSQWHKLANLQNDRTALIRSAEITSHIGHANLHGLKEWVNVYIDKPGWTANDAARAVRAQGGLFCVNHAFSGDLSWRVQDLDWDLVDMEEIYHNLEGANNSYQLSLWDQHLNQGYRIVGVAGTDSHNPFEGLHELGQVVTWVYADELSEEGVLKGLRRGQVYISRGPTMSFEAQNQSGTTARMWESLNQDGPVTLHITAEWKEPLSLFIIKNGLIQEVITTTPDDTGHHQATYTDENPMDNSYYRIELHDTGKRENYSGIIWRDYSTMRILSNPIWVNRK